MTGDKVDIWENMLENGMTDIIVMVYSVYALILQISIDKSALKPIDEMCLLLLMFFATFCGVFLLHWYRGKSSRGGKGDRVTWLITAFLLGHALMTLWGTWALFGSANTEYWLALLWSGYGALSGAAWWAVLGDGNFRLLGESMLKFPRVVIGLAFFVELVYVAIRMWGLL